MKVPARFGQYKLCRDRKLRLEFFSASRGASPTTRRQQRNRFPFVGLPPLEAYGRSFVISLSDVPGGRAERQRKGVFRKGTCESRVYIVTNPVPLYIKQSLLKVSSRMQHIRV